MPPFVRPRHEKTGRAEYRQHPVPSIALLATGTGRAGSIADVLADLDFPLGLIADPLGAREDIVRDDGSGHTDAIVTADREKAERSMNLVDSADVFWNTSTRFSDGYRYGSSVEVGVSTYKIHARDPVGLDGLAIHKWKLLGKGEIVADYPGPNARKFTHKKLR